VVHFARAGLSYWDAAVTTDGAIRQNQDWLPMNWGIAASLNTPLALELGAARAERFAAFWDELAREWAGLA
ncbi:MAG: hypothetical protein KJ734_12330, partial [Chloroflexi bacterium]|nr:hypothetical protein [Chloroflexota bacterium]